MKLNCALLVAAASLAIMAPLTECRPAFELAGLGESVSGFENVLSNKYRVETSEGGRYDKIDRDDDDDDIDWDDNTGR